MTAFYYHCILHPLPFMVSDGCKDISIYIDKSVIFIESIVVSSLSKCLAPSFVCSFVSVIHFHSMGAVWIEEFFGRFDMLNYCMRCLISDIYTEQIPLPANLKFSPSSGFFPSIAACRYPFSPATVSATGS